MKLDQNKEVIKARIL